MRMGMTQQNLALLPPLDVSSGANHVTHMLFSWLRPLNDRYTFQCLSPTDCLVLLLYFMGRNDSFVVV